MAKVSRTYSRYTREAVELLGKMIRLGRKQRKFTLQELAERAGISRSSLQRMEKGDPGCEIGTMFEVASLVGVPLFSADREGLKSLDDRVSDRLALLPEYVRKPVREVDDDF